jgi:hypothetical protein
MASTSLGSPQVLAHARGGYSPPIQGIAIAAAILAGLTVIKLGIVRPLAAAWSRPFD